MHHGRAQYCAVVGMDRRTRAQVSHNVRNLTHQTRRTMFAILSVMSANACGFSRAFFPSLINPYYEQVWTDLLSLVINGTLIASMLVFSDKPGVVITDVNDAKLQCTLFLQKRSSGLRAA